MSDIPDKDVDGDRNALLLRATDDPILARDAHERALAIATLDWPDPNERCAAVTIALALLVERENVTIKRVKWLKEIWTCYKSVKLDLPDNIAEKSIIFTLLAKAPDNSRADNPSWLENLADTYQDHKNGIEARDDLRRYLPMSKDADSQAALLGLAWARLQRKAISTSALFTYDSSKFSGLRIGSDELGISIGIDSDRIICLRSPWMPIPGF